MFDQRNNVPSTIRMIVLIFSMALDWRALRHSCSGWLGIRRSKPNGRIGLWYIGRARRPDVK